VDPVTAEALHGDAMEAIDEKSERLIDEGVRASVRLLKKNLRPEGILAASPTERAEKRNYTRVFGRDAAICVPGMVLSGDAELAEGAERSLRSLAEHQADNGQIPKYIDPRYDDADFWYIGCIDATLWWLIAMDFMARHGHGEFRQSLEPRVQKALGWLQCQEHPRLHLLQQNEASDWADIMPRSGFVLYTNALWYHVKLLYGLPYLEDTKYHFNHLFFPFSRETPDYRRLRLLTDYVKNRVTGGDLYLSFVNFSFWGDEGDVFGNLLAILFGLAEPGPAGRILAALGAKMVERPYPVRAVCNPIRQSSPLWRTYMARHGQNLEYQYHNGGIWPFIGAFWVLALAQYGDRTVAEEDLIRLAELNRINGWEFNEWFHGLSAEPRGMAGQSWNAAMFIVAEASRRGSVF